MGSPNILHHLSSFSKTKIWPRSSLHWPKGSDDDTERECLELIFSSSERGAGCLRWFPDLHQGKIVMSRTQREDFYVFFKSMRCPPFPAPIEIMLGGVTSGLEYQNFAMLRVRFDSEVDAFQGKLAFKEIFLQGGQKNQ